MISPVRPRATASGLHRISVLWFAITRQRYGPRARQACTPNQAAMGRFDRISHVRETGSTNDDMARMLGEERARGLTLVAEFQHRGAGRKGRAWIAPPGSALLCTIALPDSLPASRLWAVPFWIALAVRGALARFGIDCALQWPNDVLIRGRKVAGILCISRVSGEQAWAACGVGINVRRPENDDCLEAIQPPPAFISDYAHVSRDDVLNAVLEEAD